MVQHCWTSQQWHPYCQAYPEYGPSILNHYTRGTNPHQDHAATVDGSGEPTLEDAQVSLSPQIANELLAVHADVRPLGGDRLGCLPPIAQAHRLAAVLQVLDHEERVGRQRHDAGALAERILVDLDDLRDCRAR